MEVLQRLAPEQTRMREFLKQFERVLTRRRDILPAFPPYLPEQHHSVVEQLEHALRQISTWLECLAERDNELKELHIRTDLLVGKLEKIRLPQGLCWVEKKCSWFCVAQYPC